MKEKWNGNFEKDRESNVWCETDGEKEDKGPSGDVGMEGNSGSDGKMLRRDDGHVLRRALEFEVKGKKKWGWSKKTWKIQVEESKSVCLEKEDALNRGGVGEIAVRVG